MFDAEALPEAQAIAFDATPQAKAAPAPPRIRLRKQLFAGLAGAIALAALGAGGAWLATGARYVATDNAYVDATSAQVTPMIAAPVRQLLVADTQAVKQGQVLVVLDDTDARIALASAQAELGAAQRRVQGYFETGSSLKAQISARLADQAKAAAGVAAARSDMEKARLDLERRQRLAPQGFVTGEELARVQNGFDAAQASYQAALAAQAQAQADREAAKGALGANAALTANATVDTNPEVMQARAKVEQAKVDLERTVIRAPIDGVIAKNAVQVGQRVTAGVPLMTVVPVQQAYVSANFKEGQLAKVRQGQPVELTSDLYGSKVKFHGRVVGLGGGTGSAFALIPAQNATGNWIKVVQRLPVRVALDPAELAAHPLRVGLSMNAKIDLKR
jgi:membrane fusion protein (multidrug efflux system)